MGLEAVYTCTVLLSESSVLPLRYDWSSVRNKTFKEMYFSFAFHLRVQSSTLSTVSYIVVELSNLLYRMAERNYPFAVVSCLSFIKMKSDNYIILGQCLQWSYHIAGSISVVHCISFLTRLILPFSYLPPDLNILKKLEIDWLILMIRINLQSCIVPLLPPAGLRAPDKCLPLSVHS